MGKRERKACSGGGSLSRDIISCLVSCIQLCWHSECQTIRPPLPLAQLPQSPPSTPPPVQLTASHGIHLPPDRAPRAYQALPKAAVTTLLHNPAWDS